MGQPFLPNPKALIEAGINPKTKLPYRMGNIGDAGNLANDMHRLIRILDEQDAVNCFTWYNLPCNITGQEIERLLYYKGQLAFFYLKATNEFYFLPYSLSGTIDLYGRFNRIHPVPMTTGSEENKDHKKTALEVLIDKLNLYPKYAVPLTLTLDDLTNSCVLLHDYTKQMSQTIIPRAVINEPLIKVESEMLPFMRTNLIGGTGIMAMRVNDADCKENVDDANNMLLHNALKGRLYTPITSNIEIQEITGKDIKKAEEYALAMQTIDNLRLSTHGLENGGLFEKKAHLLESENDVNQCNTGLVMNDKLKIRQNFCNIVNAIWDLDIWCEPSEAYLQTDIDGDGDATDRNNEGNKSGVETQGGEEDETTI